MKTTLEEKIEEQFGEIVFKFPILHHGWEGDGFGFITEKNKKRKIVLTNHNNPYQSSSGELKIKLNEYEQAISAVEKALKQINELA